MDEFEETFNPMDSDDDALNGGGLWENYEPTKIKKNDKNLSKPAVS